MITKICPTDSRWRAGLDPDTWNRDGWTLHWQKAGNGWELRSPFGVVAEPMRFGCRKQILTKETLDDAIYFANGEAGE